MGGNPINYIDPYGLKSNIGVGGQVGSTTVGISGGYGWNSGAQWGQTTQIGVGFGIEVCFNLPDDDDNSDSGDGSDCDKDDKNNDNDNDGNTVTSTSDFGPLSISSHINPDSGEWIGLGVGINTPLPGATVSYNRSGSYSVRDWWRAFLGDPSPGKGGGRYPDPRFNGCP